MSGLAVAVFFVVLIVDRVVRRLRRSGVSAG